jgi:AraC family transcriptional regulator of adaptative response / DNA-3-methyladenine glycosylase II
VLLDHDRCYHALASRDARFDGHFVAVVRTTGIYCRPSCPAITPKRGNVDFVPTTAAAQQRGFRACRRCLPDAVPGSPDWNTRADLAARAMRLIADGVVEREGVPGLAGRLGYSDRHVTRVLTAEVGAGPLALARAHRAHTARLLIETTPLGMADVAFAAGFASVRQFNDTVRTVYGVPPTQLRTEAGRRRRGGAPPSAAGTLVLRLPHRGPFDAAGLLHHLAVRALDGVERAGATGHARTLALPHGAATTLLEPQDGHVRATLRLTDPRDLGPAVARLRRLLDLDADPVAVDAVLGADPALAPRVAAVPGIRVPGTVDGFETAVRAVLGQQVSLAAGVTATARLAAALGEPLPPALAADGPDRLFPTARAVAERGADVLTGPRRRTATLLALAAAVADGSLVLDAGRNPADLRAALLALPGVGPWTAGYVALRVTGDPDELLATDLAVRRGAAALGLPSDVGGLTARAQPWRPWRSYAAAHLWRTAATPTEEVPA